MNFNPIPNFSNIEHEALAEEALKYYKQWKLQLKQNALYINIITQLTDQPVDNFIQQDSEDNTFTIHEENITSFKIGGESRVILLKLKNVVESCNHKIKELEEINSCLQRELKSDQLRSSNIIKDLQTQIHHLRESDPIERRSETFRKLFERRKHIPIKDILSASNTQSVILNHLLSGEYLSSLKDGRDDLFIEQQEVELNIIESCIASLRSHFDLLPTGVVRLDRSTISYDIELILSQLLDSRSRLSHIMKEDAFISFLSEHIREVGEILELFNGRSTGQDDLTIMLSPYEKGIIFYTDKEQESYLHCCEKFIDIQKRLMVCSRASNKISPYEKVYDIPSSFLYCQIEDVVKVLFIKNKPINNIVYVHFANCPIQDHYSFFYLNSIIDGTRHWTLDCYLLNIMRTFKCKFSNTGSEIFRRFYKDVFGHNDYISGFEDILEAKGIERWKQVKILYENIQISMDEYLVGEIIRKVIRALSPLYPQEGVDLFVDTQDTGAATTDFKRMKKRWQQGLPAFEEEPEDFMPLCFTKYKKWNPETTRSRYYARWACFLKQEKYCLA